MLLYRPPFLMVDGLTAFPDHADPLTYYYIYSIPEFVTDGGVPAFFATAILPPVQTGTSNQRAEQVSRLQVSFDVLLAPSPALLTKLAEELEKRTGQAPKRLTPAPLHKGKAKLIVARPGANQPENDFFVWEGFPPSLMGTNRAAYALAAQGIEGQALAAALTVDDFAAVVAYELEFLGLSPAFQASMRVDWKQVYTRFRETDRSNFVFVSDEIDRTIESLRQTSAIQIEITELDPEAKSSAGRALFDELRKEVIQKLFENPRAMGDTPIEERIGKGVRDVLTSIAIGVHHSLRTVDQSELRAATIDIHEQKVRSYPFFPQSTLSGMIRRVGGVRERLKWVSLDSLPNRLEEVPVEVSADSATVGVKQVLIQVRAEAVPADGDLLLDKTLVLKPGETTVARYRRRGTAEAKLQFRADMMLDPERAPGGREKFPFDWRPVEGGRIWFDAEEWLDTAELRVEVDDTRIFDQQVRVAMEVEARSPSIPPRSFHLDFDKQNPSRFLRVVVPEGAAVSFQGTETFRKTNEPDLTRAFDRLEPPVHRIMNPYARVWTMELRAVADWTLVDAMFAELRVWDPVRKTWLRDEKRFSRDAALVTLRFDTSLETPQKAEARLTRAGRDGSLIRGPWTDLTGPVVALREPTRAERRVRVRLVAPRFDALAVRRAVVDLNYEDTPSGIAVQQSLEFRAAGAVQDWVHTFPNPSQADYRYKLRAFGRNGERFVAKEAVSAADDLDVVLPGDAW